MKKALLILAEGFEEIEAVTPVDLLRRAGILVTVAALGDLIIVKGTRGLEVQADCLFNEVESDFDALILPGGGNGANNLASSEKVLSLIEKMNREGSLIAAICASSAVVLGKTDVLSGKRATCYPGCEVDFRSDVIYVEESVVIVDNIITSRGPGTASEFSLAIIKVLLDDNSAISISKKTLF